MVVEDSDTLDQSSDEALVELGDLCRLVFDEVL